MDRKITLEVPLVSSWQRLWDLVILCVRPMCLAMLWQAKSIVPLMRILWTLKTWCLLRGAAILRLLRVNGLLDLNIR